MKKIHIKKIPKNSIQRRISVPTVLLIIFQSLLVVSIIFGSGVISQLRSNAGDILYERVSSRKNYLETTMANTWSNVGLTVQQVNQYTQGYLTGKGLTPQLLDDNSSVCAPLLNSVSELLITMIRNNSVTGAFVVLNTDDLGQDERSGIYHSKTGIYLRDTDPKGGNSINNADLLVECGPTSVVQKQGIPTSSTWDTVFNFQKRGAYAPFLYYPFQNALKLGAEAQEMALTDLGYWSRAYPVHTGEDTKAIYYSVPLLLDDGTVYGVLGVEITLDYLKSFLPYSELHEDQLGSYLLCVGQGDMLTFDQVVVNGSILAQSSDGSLQNEFTKTKLGDTPFYYLESGKKGDERQFSTIEYLNLYNSNTAFSGERWALVGTVRNGDLFEFAQKIQFLLIVCIAIVFFVGVCLSVLISYYISMPVLSLAEDMEDSDPRKPLRLKRTKIKEIDQLSATLEKVSQDVIDSANKFTRIMEMSSTRMSGFEIDINSKRLFLTEGFFNIFELHGIDESRLSLDEFTAYMQTLKRYFQPQESTENEYVFKIHTVEGNTYVRLTVHQQGNHWYGLAEDVTRTIKERQVIEHERDYDLLTGLINRRAFHRTMEDLFRKGVGRLKVAALLMLDLDNLKQINDNYGHDCGDIYIQSAASVFKRTTPVHTVVSRISGDEFYIFLYGYDTKQEVLGHLDTLKKEIDQTICRLPGGHSFPLRLSGGYVWYPEDSDSYTDLLRYSDFAMYKVKQGEKGTFAPFDKAIYDSESYLIQNKADLTRLIDEEAVVFHFQPIVDAHTGVVFAYEALMRSNIPTLRMPVDILRLARMEHKLNHIETLTWFKSLEAFSSHIEGGLVGNNCKLFINSIGDQIMSTEKTDELVGRYDSIFHRVVMEITEEQRLETNLQEIKMRVMRSYHSGIALDDFGSGYNSEKNLLELEPDYVKIDNAIIRNIGTDSNKQLLLKNIITYAHKGGMKVVAEGVETIAELEMSVQLGADYLQGYYLARPAELPPVIEDETVDIIRRIAADNGFSV